MMKSIIALLLVMYCTLILGNGIPPLNDLSELRWKNRILLINTVTDIENVLALLDFEQHEIVDRNIVWFIFNNDTVLNNYQGKLSDSFIPSTLKKYKIVDNQVILIGKDGGVKERIETLDLSLLFTQIDAMPMRRREMQKQHN